MRLSFFTYITNLLLFSITKRPFEAKLTKITAPKIKGAEIDMQTLLFFVVFAVMGRFTIGTWCNCYLRQFAAMLLFVVMSAGANIAHNCLLIVHIFLHLLLSLCAFVPQIIP